MLFIDGVPEFIFALYGLVSGIDLCLPESAVIPVVEYWRLLLSASAWQQSAESVSGDRVSADTVLLRLKQLQWQQVKAGFDAVFRDVLVVARKQRRFTRPLVVAIDFHDFPYYGDKSHPMLVRGKAKNGTTYFFRYASLDVVESGRRYTIAMMPVDAETTKREVLEVLISIARKYLRIRFVLLDAGFYGVGDVDTLEALNIEYVIRPRMSWKLAAAAVECLQQKQRAFTYPLGAEGRPVPMAVAERDGEYRVYLTSVDPQQADLWFEFGRRWGIETGYRVHEDFQAKTTSPNYSIRLTLWLLAIYLYNLWVLGNHYTPAAPPKNKDTVESIKLKPAITTFKMRRHLIHHLDPP